METGEFIVCKLFHSKAEGKTGGKNPQGLRFLLSANYLRAAASLILGILLPLLWVLRNFLLISYDKYLVYFLQNI